MCFPNVLDCAIMYSLNSHGVHYGTPIWEVRVLCHSVPMSRCDCLHIEPTAVAQSPDNMYILQIIQCALRYTTVIHQLTRTEDIMVMEIIVWTRPLS